MNITMAFWRRAITVVALVAAAWGTTGRAETAVPTSDFLDSIGVCTHMTQGIDNPTQVASCLTYAGFRNFRDDGSTTASTIQKWIDVHNASGALACILPKNGDVAGSVAMYKQVAQAGALLAIEGPNEPNNWPVNYLGQYGGGTKLTTTTAATINNSAYYNTAYRTGRTGTWAYGPVGFKYGSSTAYVTSQSYLGVLRNDLSGWVGYKFTVGGTAITVNELGRWVVSGNTGTHAVRLVRVSDSAVLGTVSVATSGATAGAFKYATLTPPVTLAANTAYYVMSQETSGGDQWHDGYYNSFPTAWFCRDLYAAVKADPVLQDYPVFASSEAGGSEPNNVGLQYLTIPTPLPSGVLMPAGTVYADFANTHNYVCNQAQLGIRDNQCWLASSPGTDCIADGLYKEYGYTWWSPGYLGYSLAELETLPRVSTETGWVTQGTDPITEVQQGKLFLNLFLSAYKRGWSNTFIYMLRDDPTQGYWGLFRTDYTPKLSATYLHNMTTLLADTGTFSAGSLAYSIPSQPTTVHDLLMQKGNGTFYLAVWNERASGSDTITVDLGGVVSSLKVYDPTIGTSAQQTWSNISALSVTLSDHPVILEISGYVQDTTPPTVPQNVTAVAVSSSQINLSWSASSDAVGVVGYDIIRNGQWIALSTTTSYSNTGLIPNTSYTYRVAAFDAAENTSADSAPASATTLSASSGLEVIFTDFISNASNQTLNGTQIGLTLNLPNSTWVWGAGWNWGSPYVPATWMSVDKNVVNLAEEKTAVGVSLASSGSYTKPTEFTIKADMRFTTKNGGLGFWSVMPARTDGGSPFVGFTGIYVDIVAGTLRVYENGTAQGTAVNVGPLNSTTYYAIAYDVNTANGAISNVSFGGLPVSGLSSTAFTGAATAYAGALSGFAARASFDNFAITRKPVIPIPVIATDFVSNASNQTLNGTQIGLTTNLPNGNWIWGAGWNWGSPYVPATWMSVDKNVVNLVEEKTALGVSLASSGSYTKPTEFTIKADMRFTTKNGGLGFWSVMPARTDGGSPFVGFTGIYVDIVAGTLRLYGNGTAQGTAVSVGALSSTTYYTLSYDVNTANGTISNVSMGGVPVSGLSSTAFTGSATAYAGALSGVGARASFDNFAITSK